jgi:hypothetical protein
MITLVPGFENFEAWVSKLVSKLDENLADPTFSHPNLFWAGHGFSRAARGRQCCGLQPLRAELKAQPGHL